MFERRFTLRCATTLREARTEFQMCLPSPRPQRLSYQHAAATLVITLNYWIEHEGAELSLNLVDYKGSRPSNCDWCNGAGWQETLLTFRYVCTCVSYLVPFLLATSIKYIRSRLHLHGVFFFLFPPHTLRREHSSTVTDFVAVSVVICETIVRIILTFIYIYIYSNIFIYIYSNNIFIFIYIFLLYLLNNIFIFIYIYICSNNIFIFIFSQIIFVHLLFIFIFIYLIFISIYLFNIYIYSIVLK